MLEDPSMSYLARLVPSLRHLMISYDRLLFCNMTRYELLPSLPMLERISIYDAISVPERLDRLAYQFGAGRNSLVLVLPTAWSGSIKEIEIWPAPDDRDLAVTLQAASPATFRLNPFVFMPRLATLPRLSAFTVRVFHDDMQYAEKAADCIIGYNQYRAKLSPEEQAIVRYKSASIRVDGAGARSWDCDGN